MGVAMLSENVRYVVPFGTGSQWLKMCVQGGQAQPLLPK